MICLAALIPGGLTLHPIHLPLTGTSHALPAQSPRQQTPTLFPELLKVHALNLNTTGGTSPRNQTSHKRAEQHCNSCGKYPERGTYEQGPLCKILQPSCTLHELTANPMHCHPAHDKSWPPTLCIAILHTTTAQISNTAYLGLKACHYAPPPAHIHWRHVPAETHPSIVGVFQHRLHDHSPAAAAGGASSPRHPRGRSGAAKSPDACWNQPQAPPAPLTPSQGCLGRS